MKLTTLPKSSKIAAAVILGTLAPVVPALTSTAHAETPPAIVGLSGATTVSQYGKFETSATVTPQPANPFDPAQIDVEGHFSSPGGVRYAVPGFWFQDYVRSQDSSGNELLTPTGSPDFRVRFAPPTPGQWSWYWTVTTPAGTTTSPAAVLSVTASTDHGYLRTSKADNRYLAFDDGTGFTAIGENVGFPGTGSRTYSYDSVFNNLSRNGANFARILVNGPFAPHFPEAFGLEWTDTGLGDYTKRLPRAWELDHITSEAEQLGIYEQLSVLWHGEFSTTNDAAWSYSPYNVANGGPLSEPDQLFTDPTARMYVQRMLRYIVARWGYSTHIAAWELINEADHVDGYNATIAHPWYETMASYIRSIDPAHHAVTSTVGGQNADYNMAAQTGLDDSAGEHYESSMMSTGTNWPLELVNVLSSMRQHNPAAPPLIVEESVSSSAGSSGFLYNDPQQVGFHDGMWAPLFAGGYGTGNSWYWAVIDAYPTRFYPHYKALSAYLAGARLDTAHLNVSRWSISPPGKTVDVYGLVGPNLALYWLKDRAAQWNASTPLVPVRMGSFQVGASATGRWCGAWWDTRQGVPVASLSNVPSWKSVPIPQFDYDIALKVSSC